MRLKKICKWVFIAFIVCFGLCLSALGYIRWEIQSGLDEWSEIAQVSHPHPEDDIAALMDYVQSSSHTLRERNYAVWALGQARDKRALPILEKYYTGEKCDHDKKLCQGELKKSY